MMEYTIAGFAPIILSAVSATALTRFVFGAEPAFTVPPLHLASLFELPYLLVIGLVIGALAALFITSLKWLTTFSSQMIIWQRLTLAGFLTGLCALLVPEIMGVGYDTVNQAMLGQLGVGLLLLIVLFKIMATTIGLGLGLPGGLIGPTLVIGAAAGGVLGLLAEAVFPGQVASPGFYAMLGMGAMMGATLQAPLAALLAMLELTANPNIILPGMLAVVVAGITSSHLFRCESVFLTLLKARGLDVRNDPITQLLRKVGVASALDPAFIHADRIIDINSAKNLLKHQPQWVIVIDNSETNEQEANTKTNVLLLASDLANYLSSQTQNQDEEAEAHAQAIDLLDIPAQRETLALINQQATLQQALDIMDEKKVNALCVSIHQTDDATDIIGIVTRQTVESHYRSGITGKHKA